MSKERLEEFKDYIDFLDDSADMQDHGRFVDTCMNLYEDGWFHWIYRYAKGQAETLDKCAERNKELEEDYEYLSHHYGLETEQNKRYREYLGLIEKVGTFADNETKEVIKNEQADLASEALESESHEEL